MIGETQVMLNGSSGAHWNSRGARYCTARHHLNPPLMFASGTHPGERLFSTQSSRSGDQHLITGLPPQEAKSNTTNIGSEQKPPHERRTHDFHCLISHPHKPHAFILRPWPLLCLREITSSDSKMNCPAKQCYSQ